MSQNKLPGSPGSPRSPRSKSPSCEEPEGDGELQENIPHQSHNELHEAVAELRSADRVALQGQWSGSRTSPQGGGSPAQASSHTRPPSDSRPLLPQDRSSYASPAQASSHTRPPSDSRPLLPQERSSYASPAQASSHTRPPSDSRPLLPQDRSPYASPAQASSHTRPPSDSRLLLPQDRSSYPSPAQASSHTRPPSDSRLLLPQDRSSYSSPGRASPPPGHASGMSQPSCREDYSPSPRSKPSQGGTSAVTFGTKSSTMNYEQAVQAPSRVDNRSYKCSASGADGGVDVSVSAMTYVLPSERSAVGRGYVPGCQKFMRDPGSSPYARDFPQTGYQRHSPVNCQPGGSGKFPQQHADHLMMSPDSGYISQQSLRAPSPNFERGATPPSYQSFTRPSTVPGNDHSHHHHHHHHAEGHEGLPARDEKVVAALGHLSQFKKTPSYFRCGITDDSGFAKACSAKVKQEGKTGRAFPEIPSLCPEDIDELIKCETQDVESAWFLTADERKTYKKPCPKQQRAQMNVKALMQAHAAQACQKDYTPLEHPDPEDISPELAAAMMFSQESGIKMEECPKYTIASLFPDEPRTTFPEKIPPSSISIVDRNSKEQDEMIEKSASVPSEGVSDSAYTRMKEKGSEDLVAQKSFDVDFAIGHSKREYILVAQKPQRINKAHYRGGNSSPSLFPGYYSAFPDEQGLKVVSSPSRVFEKAWIHSNPGNMPASDVIVLD